MTLYTKSTDQLSSIFFSLLLVKPDTITGLAIQTAIEEKMPVHQIAKQLWEQSKDNREAVVRCIGESLMQKIEKLCESK